MVEIQLADDSEYWYLPENTFDPGAGHIDVDTAEGSIFLRRNKCDNDLLRFEAKPREKSKIFVTEELTVILQPFQLLWLKRQVMEVYL